MKRGKKLLIARSLTAVTLAVWSGLFRPPQAAFIGVSPAVVSLAVEPGQVCTGRLIVFVHQESTVAVAMGDWSHDRYGRTYYPPAQSLIPERSLCPWIEIAPARLVVKPGKPQALSYRLTVPAGITGAYWGTIFITLLARRVRTTETLGLTAQPRIGVKVMAETGRGAVRDGRIGEVKAEWTGQEGLKAAAVFNNFGNTILRPKGRFEIRDRSGATVAKIPMAEEIVVLPGADRIIAGAYRAQLKPGNYVLLAIVDYGAKCEVAGQRSFKVHRP